MSKVCETASTRLFANTVDRFQCELTNGTDESGFSYLFIYLEILILQLNAKAASAIINPRSVKLSQLLLYFDEDHFQLNVRFPL